MSLKNLIKRIFKDKDTKMKLKDFIKIILKDIALATAETNSELESSELYQLHLLKDGKRQPMTVDFDIAVSAEGEQHKDGKIEGHIGVKVLEVIGPGISGEKSHSSTSTNSTVSRIKFSIAVDPRHMISAIEKRVKS